MSEVLTLILAWRIAREYKQNESKAIYLCALRLWKQVEDYNSRQLVIQLADRKTSDYKRVAAVEELERRLRSENII